MDVVLWLPKWCVGALTASVLYVIIIDCVSATVVVTRVAPLGINGDFILSGLLRGFGWSGWCSLWLPKLFVVALVVIEVSIVIIRFSRRSSGRSTGSP